MACEGKRSREGGVVPTLLSFSRRAISYKDLRLAERFHSDDVVLQ